VVGAIWAEPRKHKKAKENNVQANFTNARPGFIGIKSTSPRFETCKEWIQETAVYAALG
jgi:hypothetical protein